MKYLIAIPLVFIFSCVNSQSSFFTKIVSGEDVSVSEVNFINNFVYVGNLTYVGINPITVKSQIHKFDIECNLLNSIEITHGDSSYFFLDNQYSVNDTTILVMGSMAEKVFTKKGFYYVAKMNPELEVYDEHFYAIDGHYAFKSSVAVCADSNLLIGTTIYDRNTSVRKVLLLKITPDGDSITSKYLTDSASKYGAYINDIKRVGNTFKLSLEGFKYFFPTTTVVLMEMDSALNITKVIKAPVHPYSTSLPLSMFVADDTTYYIGGTTVGGSSWIDMSVLKLDASDNVLATATTKRPGYMPDYPAIVRPLSSYDGNNLYLGGYFNGPAEVCADIDQKLILSNYDSQLNCRWTYFYGGDACYVLSCVEATPDGGCLLAGMVTDQDSLQNMGDVFLMKVDSTGIFTSSSLPDLKVKQAFAYPNPGNDGFWMKAGEQLKGATLMVYNEYGCAIQETIINETHFWINLSNEEPGIYIWKIDKQGKFIESGKWIKN